MPKEVRYILFTPEEVRVAVLDQREPNWLRGHAGPLPEIELFQTAHGDVVARLVRGLRPGDPPAKDIHRDDLVRALLARCRAMRIPLPRRGHKGLELMGDRLAMTVMLNTVPAEVEATQGRIRYADAETNAVRSRLG